MIALSSPAAVEVSSVIGTLRTELEIDGLRSLSKLDRIYSPLVRLGEVTSMDEREDVRRGGGGLGALVVVFDDEVVGVVDSDEGGGMEVADRLEDALCRAGGGGGDFRLGVRLMEDAGDGASSVIEWLLAWPLRLVGGGGGATRVEEVVLSAMLSLSSARYGRDDDCPLLVLSNEATGCLCDDRRASGGGGGILDCEDGLSDMSGLGVGSRETPLLDACANASLMELLATGVGGSGLFPSPETRALLLSSVLATSCSCPKFEKSSNATICGPDTDLPCL